MEEMRMTFTYVTARARQLGRTIFRSEAGALTLEWVVIGGLLVLAAAIGAKLFDAAIRSQASKLK